MALKKGNVRLQVTVSEQTMRELDQLREMLKWSKSMTVAHAISCLLIDEIAEREMERAGIGKEVQEGDEK